MNIKATHQRQVCTAVLLTVLCLAKPVLAQTTAFTYQGKLTDAGNPANGPFDLQFRLLDALVGGNQVGTPLIREDVTVTNGIFTVTLDFGAAAFPGTNRFLEIAVRPGASTGAFTTLGPLQPITSTPYALQSLNAATATNAANATTAANFSGALTGDVTGTQGATTVAKLRGQAVGSTAPTAGQVLKYNGTTNQWEAAADNNSGGTLTGVTAGTGLSGGGASGNVTLNIANGGVGTAQLADNGVTDAKINSVSGSKVTGAVANATTAVNATTATTATTAVNFSGALGGDVTGNQTATTVEKLRHVSLPAPVLADHGKVLKYKNNGVDPITFEWAADNNAGGTLTNVTASVPLASSGGATPNISLTGLVPLANGGTGANLAATGGTGQYLKQTSAGGVIAVGAIPAADLPDLSASYIKNGTAAQAGANFNLSGNGTAGGTLSGQFVNATMHYNIGGARVLSTPGSSNLFAGVNAGTVNTGFSNSFFGESAGRLNTEGFSNSFFGRFAGFFNTTGDHNSFFGSLAGQSNTTGRNNSFFGESAGYTNTTGQDNSFFGTDAGQSNTTGGGNAFFGVFAGDSNTTGGNNAFFGASAGFSNTTGTSNAFFGTFAGGSNTTGTNNISIGTNAASSNTTENDNTFIGSHTNGVAGITNATALGARAKVTTSNSLVLGSISGVNAAADDTNVGIGTTAPAKRLHILGAGDQELAIESSDASGRQWTLQSSKGTSNGRFEIIDRTAAANRFTILSDGSVGIGTTAPADRLHVNGIIRVATLGEAGPPNSLCRNASNQLSTCSSSLRYKNHIFSLRAGLELIQRLRPVSFNWKASGEQDLGLIAEEVAAIEPLLVTHNAKGEIEGVKYVQLNVVLINAIKQQQEQLETQTTQIAAQQTQLKRQQQQFDALKKLVCQTNPQADVCKE